MLAFLIDLPYIPALLVHPLILGAVAERWRPLRFVISLLRPGPWAPSWIPILIVQDSVAVRAQDITFCDFGKDLFARDLSLNHLAYLAFLAAPVVKLDRGWMRETALLTA